MNRYRKLINNSIIFTIGSFGSRLISLFMVPLYTHLLSTEEYGAVDLVTTTISLLIPFITLEIGQASLRFAIDSKNEIERTKIFSNISLQGLIGSLIIVFLIPLFYMMNLFEGSEILFVLLLMLSVFNNLYSQYIRGVGLVKKFAINGIIMTFATVSLNLFFLLGLNLKVEGYLLSLIFANIISNIYLFYVANGVQKLKNFNVDIELLKKMLKFSVPMIPNGAMWWIISGSTRYFVLFFVGAAGNGLYAVANKLPSIISMVTTIFSQAWQLSSFEEYESKDKDAFYSKIFRVYTVILFLTGSAIVVILKPLLNSVVESSFYESWRIAPILIFAVIYQSFSSFLGTNYTASRETKGTFTTSIYGGIISIISNIVLVPLFGTTGAAISSALSFFSMFVIRLIDTKKYVVINFNKSVFIRTNIFFISQVVFLFILDGIPLFISQFTLFLCISFINKEILLIIYNIIASNIKSKIKK